MVSAFQKGGRLFYVGAGTSGRLGVLDASECPPTYGVSPDLVQGIIAGGIPALTHSQEGAEDHPEDGEAALKDRGCTSDDVVMGIAASGVTPFVLGALEYAQRIGAKALFFTCNPDVVGKSTRRCCNCPCCGARSHCRLDAYESGYGYQARAQYDNDNGHDPRGQGL